MASSSPQFNLTLPPVQANALREVATERGVSVPQIIRERLSEWESLSSTQKETDHSPPYPDLAAFTTQLQQLVEQLNSVQQAVEQLSDLKEISAKADRPNSPQPDPQTRAALQPVHARLQQVETQVGVIGNLVQQIVQQTGKHQLRLEAWSEAIYVIVQPLLIDNQPDDIQKSRQEWIKELHHRLQQHLETCK
ncbi:hypothetical protein ACQ4M3_32950 [Leptolyngbya sp. AN03gr2]|uniref:hypothetical protein n=1 Tax=unclassified Leptolyngbya TaxID=2650499 RepID=UPI003D322ECA